MQNHGGYSDDRLFDDKNNVKFTDLNGYPNVEQYLSLVRQSDQAFKMLIDYFSKQKEPTLILLYGDHQPALYSDFHNKIEEANQMAVNTSKYLVPFVIWANYDIQEADVDKISANYLSSYLLNTAGLKGTKYNHYLMNLYKKLPVINGLFYIDKDNNCYNLGEQSKYSDLITEYRYIGYNNVFDKKNRLDNVYHLELR
jgi:phosphoglycerol transferase MdoB-like AlkP superfamily enzyme